MDSCPLIRLIDVDALSLVFSVFIFGSVCQKVIHLFCAKGTKIDFLLILC